MSDYIRPVRIAVLTRLKGTTGVTSIVPATSIHPSTTPDPVTWPFIRWDGPNSLPRGMDCMAGADVTFFVHAFAKARTNGSGQIIETAEDHASRIIAAVKIALHRAPLVLPGAYAKVRVTSVQSMMDGAEKTAWHGIASCIARVTRTT